MSPSCDGMTHDGALSRHVRKSPDMNIPPLESEYDASALPQVDGGPLTNNELDAQVLAMDSSRRVESSRQTLIMDAVHSFYLAKRYLQIVLSFDGYTNTVVPSALDAIGHNMLRLAVVAVASVNDNDNRGRTRSLPHSIDALHRALAGVTDRDVSAELVGLQRIKDDINADRELSLKYLRHVRNKWAGHASLDRVFDDWAQADSVLSLPLIEDALVRLVNAHQEFADLIDSSEVLRGLAADPQDSDGGDSLSRVIPMRVEWGSVTTWALVQREWARRAAEALVDQLQSPPGYGTKEDTDWGPGSEHQRRRSLVDEAAKRAIESNA
jgi:hypothetical protein